MAAASSVMASLSLKPSGFTVEKTVAGRGLPSLARTSSLRVEASGGKKIKTDKPYGINGGMSLRDGLDASGRKGKGKGVYQFVDKYGANVDGYRYFPIFSSAHIDSICIFIYKHTYIFNVMLAIQCKFILTLVELVLAVNFHFKYVAELGENPVKH
ncbi:photosystem II 10 kDa polypeptide, chloroplastic [Carica papaya]|uniref:photosystem II 10 kDa polypeptide, chloroplastic n=1 Tax=Carica papaya TaxID=3649 RepID=UPI000B8CDC79|nr:photosystem II 10 kDa polypeptide, chloroplastic [Carica papaya]